MQPKREGRLPHKSFIRLRWCCRRSFYIWTAQNTTPL